MPKVGFSIVGIGASAGGIDAFHSFFSHMPADCGMAFVILLHLPADRKSMLTEILARWTTMHVIEATNGMLIEPNCVYVPPPQAIVTVSEGYLGVHQPASGTDRLFRPIDGFFDSLGSEMRERAIGIVLSGTGSDGALGLKAIKECGGLTLAQGTDGTTPQYGEMPAGAIATGAVDLVVPVQDMPAHLMRLQANEVVLPSKQEDLDHLESSRLEICAILRAQLGHDFSGYRPQTFMRRVERRMQVVNAENIQTYIARLNINHDEVTLLFRDLLIRVTSFFRDKETFEILETKVIPQLFDAKNADGTVRVWVPGCATGEEAYSLAILLRERMDTLEGVPRVQVLATDIDDSSIATARLGRYPATLLDGLSSQRRQRFFAKSQGGYVVAKEIRDLCAFSTHNVIRDPPFSRMDLVSCRNLLIYMSTELQAKVVPIFHYSLVPGGILLLGGSESAAQHQNLFEPLDKGARIFRRRQMASPDLHLPAERSALHAPAPVSKDVSTPTDGAAIDRERTMRAPAEERRPSANAGSSRDGDGHNRPPSYEHLWGSLSPSAENVALLQRALGGVLEELQAVVE